MQVSKTIIVDGGYGKDIQYYTYSKYRLGKIAARKKHPSIYVNEIDKVLNRLSDEGLIRSLFYPMNDDLHIYRVELFIKYDKYDTFYMKVNTDKSEYGGDIFSFRLDRILSEFSMVDVLSEYKTNSKDMIDFMGNMAFRFGCNQFSTMSKVKSIPGYDNQSGNV